MMLGQVLFACGLGVLALVLRAVSIRRMGGLAHRSPAPGDGREGETVGLLEWHRDMTARFEKERHVDQRISDGDRLDEGPDARVGLVGRERQWPVGGPLVPLPGDLVPDRA